MQKYLSDKNNISIDFIYPNTKDQICSDLRAVSGLSFDRPLPSLEVAKKVAGHAHNLFKHDGENISYSNNPLDIINEAKKGASFRCVEYGIVASALLWAFGVPARVVGLKTKDLESRDREAGHVVVEFYSKDLNKWVMIDVQAGIIPAYKGEPLSSFELGEVLNREQEPEYVLVENSHFLERDKGAYFTWVQQYLYFFDTAISIDLNNLNTGKKLMLIPLGEGHPKVFQKAIPIDTVYTSNVLEFYKPFMYNS
jgi:hypothetical protein